MNKLIEEQKQNELNEIAQIDSIDYFISSLSTEEIQSKIDSYKRIAQSQLLEMKTLIGSVNEKVMKLTQGYKRTYIKGNGSVAALTNRADEVNQVHKQHQKKLRGLSRETDFKLKETLKDLEEQHYAEMGQLAQEHEKKVNFYYNTIETSQQLLIELNDTSKFMLKAEHDAVINQLLLKNKKDIVKYDEEISRLEENIKENYSQWISKANYSIIQPNTTITRNAIGRSCSTDITEFIQKLKYENGNDNFIFLISQMGKSAEVDENIDSTEERKSIYEDNYYRIEDKDILEFDLNEDEPIKPILVNNFVIKKYR